MKRKKIEFSFKKIFSSSAIIASLIIIFSLTFYQLNEVSTSTAGTLESKFEEDGKYYIIFDKQQIRTSENEFLLIDANQAYFITYSWNRKIKEKAKIQTIESIN